MKLKFTFIGGALVLLQACSTVNQGAQYVFTPDYYDPPNLYRTAGSNDGEGLLVKHRGVSYLNRKNSNVIAFESGMAMEDKVFAQVGYLYLATADRHCQDRISDMYQASVANDSGFGMLTTVSGIAGTAFSSGNTANVASGFATFFNSVSSNAGSVQQQINSVFTTSVISGINSKRNQDKEDASRKIIEGELKTLVSNDDGPQGLSSEIAEQARIRGKIERYNDYCTIGAGQDWVRKVVNNDGG